MTTMYFIEYKIDNALMNETRDVVFADISRLLFYTFSIPSSKGKRKCAKVKRKLDLRDIHSVGLCQFALSLQ